MKYIYLLLLYTFLYISNIHAQKIEGISPVGSLNIAKTIVPPYLSVRAGSVKFQDENGNNVLDAEETAKLVFTIENTGKGYAAGLKVKLKDKNNIKGLTLIEPHSIPIIKPNNSAEISIILKGSIQLTTGIANLELQVLEPYGFDTNLFEVQVTTRAKVPKLVITDHHFSTTTGGQMQPGTTISLQIAIQNIGGGIAENIKLHFTKPANVFAVGQEKFNIDDLKPGESKLIDFEFFTNRRYTANEVPIGIEVNEITGKYSLKDILIVKMNTHLTDTKTAVNIPVQQNKEVVINDISTIANTSVQQNQEVVINYISSEAEVDRNLPTTNMNNPDAIAVVIGNANYQRTKSVDFALNDARIMRKYLIEVLDFKDGNIIYKENAFKSDFEEVFGNQNNEKGILYNAVKPNRSDVFVFYAGHGAPGLNDQKGYFVPVNCSPQNVELTGYPADVFYANLGKIPAREVTVILDACFSGAELLEGVSPITVQSRGVREIENGALLASSSNDQVSAWYTEKKHGLFTYFFLKAIHNANADFNKDKKLTLEEIYRFVSDRTEGVPYYARRYRNVEQIPSLDGDATDRVLVEYK